MANAAAAIRTNDIFVNEPITDFTIAENRARFQEAINSIDREIREKKLVSTPIIDGSAVMTGSVIERRDPSLSEVIVGVTHFAREPEVGRAYESLSRGAPQWAATPWDVRADIIEHAAELMREERFRLAALIVREAGKPWKEADADVAEAIDFCSYYSSMARQMGSPKKTSSVLGEENIYFYQPRGIVAVISPWNFPLAIACGMTVAALVTGNAAILKPAEQTGLIAHELARVLLKAGVPGNAFAFLPGTGEVVGRTLVNHPRTDMICFTGSKAVGLEIISSAATVHEGQKAIKRVVAELGGKNAIIVDEDADLDEAVKGVLTSAFGYAGQKCSACSRVIAVGDAYEPFMSRLCEAASDLIVGEARDPSTFLGPVVDEDTQTRIKSLAEQATKTNKLAFKGDAPESGYFVPAHIFRDVEESSDIWKEEIFGPVLACRKAADFEEALRYANNSQYALTGGVFSRSPNNIATARERFAVGNLYINRGSTGALVCRQPFGGFKMSGVGSKAGGPDYLIQFVEPRTITENTMRRGFAPDVG